VITYLGHSTDTKQIQFSLSSSAAAEALYLYLITETRKPLTVTQLML